MKSIFESNISVHSALVVLSVKIFDSNVVFHQTSVVSSAFSNRSGTQLSGVVLPEQVLGGVGDGFSGGCSSTHVGDLLQSTDGTSFCGVVRQAELQPLVIGKLHCTWMPNTVSQLIISSTINSNHFHPVKLTDASSHV